MLDTNDFMECFLIYDFGVLDSNDFVEYFLIDDFVGHFLLEAS